MRIKRNVSTKTLIAGIHKYIIDNLDKNEAIGQDVIRERIGIVPKSAASWGIAYKVLYNSNIIIRCFARRSKIPTRKAGLNWFIQKI